MEFLSPISIEKLDPEDFKELANIGDGFTPNPETSVAIVARSGGKIIGRIFLLAPVHVEGPLVLDEYRGSTLLKRLVDRAESEAKDAGVTTLFAYGASEKLEEYLDRLGYTKRNLTVWSKEI